LVKACASELRNAKARFEDALADAISNSDLYEVEVATTRVNRRYPHLTEDSVLQAQECEERSNKEVKQRETRRSTKKSFLNLGYQIRGHAKPKTTKKSRLNILDIQMEDFMWHQIVGKDQVCWESNLGSRKGGTRACEKDCRPCNLQPVIREECFIFPRELYGPGKTPKKQIPASPHF
jgi:hypothetical protein